MSLTVTEIPSLTLRFTITERHERALDRLFEISRRYRGHVTDPVSLKAFEWIDKALQVNSSVVFTSETAFLQQAQSSFNELQQILSESQENTPFLNEMREWITTLEESRAPNALQAPSEILALVADPRMRQIVENAFAMTAQREAQAARMARVINRRADLLEQRFAEMQLEFQEAAQRSREYNDQHEQDLNRKIVSLEETQATTIQMHQDTQALLRATVTDVRQQNEVVRQELRTEEARADRLEAENTAQAGEIRSLRYAYAQKCQEVDNMNRRGGGGFCVIS